MTDSKPSKSSRKRKVNALQELGEQLLALNAAELSSLSLDEQLERAIRNAVRIKTRGALRRQKQFIGKLMREVDPEPIRAGLARLRADDVRAKRIFAQAESWRNRIVADGKPALDDFEAGIDAPDEILRALLSELEVVVSERAEKTVRRQIFRRIHEILVRSA